MRSLESGVYTFFAPHDAIFQTNCGDHWKHVKWDKCWPASQQEK